MQQKFRVQKTIRWEASHQLDGLPEGHQCSRMHGHSYEAQVVLVGKSLDEVGMVVDFGVISGVAKILDHKHLNEIIPGNPTAENIAKFVAQLILDTIFRMGASDDVYVERVRVHETTTCWAEVEFTP